MAFHLGVLKLLAERDALERVSRLSTVSGGSLITGLIYHANGFTWPTSQAFLTKVLPSVANDLVRRSIQARIVRRMLSPKNWRYLVSRANLLAEELNECWGFDVPISRIDQFPSWSINGTTAETGKRFRFKSDSMGDWSLGYAIHPNFKLGDALAISAAFPGLLGPLVLETSAYTWRKWTGKEPTNADPEIDNIGFKRIHVYDGGLYDNLGLEPFFDAGKQELKYEAKLADELLLVSDAGAPLERGLKYCPLGLLRLKRVADIMSDQSRALRVRGLMNYLSATPKRGALVTIIQTGSDIDRTASQFAINYPTDLKRLTPSALNLLMQHGYNTAKAALD